MRRKILRVFLIVLIVCVTLINQHFALATLGGEVDTGKLGSITTNPGNSGINNMFDTIIVTVVRVLQAMCVAGIAVNGFKYMSAGAEGKGKIKENIAWILFGLILVTSANKVISIVATAGRQSL